MVWSTARNRVVLMTRSLRPRAPPASSASTSPAGSARPRPSHRDPPRRRETPAPCPAIASAGAARPPAGTPRAERDEERRRVQKDDRCAAVVDRTATKSAMNRRRTTARQRDPKPRPVDGGRSRRLSPPRSRPCTSEPIARAQRRTASTGPKSAKAILAAIWIEAPTDTERIAISENGETASERARAFRHRARQPIIRRSSNKPDEKAKAAGLSLDPPPSSCPLRGIVGRSRRSSKVRFCQAGAWIPSRRGQRPAR